MFPIKMQRCKSALVLVSLFCSGSLYAESYDSIASRYKNENAVITNYTERLVIKFDDGKLAATSYVTEEKLLISDLAPGLYKRDYIYHSSFFNKLTDVQATASIPTKGGGYKKNPTHDFRDVHSERDYVFYDDSKELVISFTGLQKNALTETKYTMEHSDVHMLPTFYLQENLPIVKATFEISAPKLVNLNFVLKGENTGWIKQSKEEANGMITYTFTATDIPAARAYEDVPSYAYYIPHVIPYITSYKRYSEDKPTEMLSGPDQLYKYLYKYIKNINLQEDDQVNKTVAEVTKGDHTQREKAAHIYQWVQKNMHYIAFEDGLEGFIPREAKVVCDRKYGDCKDMTSILVAMCRKAGLDAHYTWIGTREKPYTNEETPLPLVTNHMICAIKLDDQWLFMDGTHPLVPFGVNPEGIQGKEAMIAIDANTYKIIKVPEAPADRNVVTDSTFISIADNNVKGTVKQYYKGYAAWDIGIMTMYYKNEEREKYIKTLTQKGSDKYLQTHYGLAASDTAGKEVRVDATFTIDDYVQQVGKQYYVNMNMNRAFEDKYIDTRERTVPYFYKYKERTNEVVVLDIPKGYHVTHLPAAARAAVDGLWGYKISYKADAKKITLVKEYELNTMTAVPKQFADNNKLVSDVKKLYKESVVLTAN
jgi:transglutaminase-like putative cysteine protease